MITNSQYVMDFNIHIPETTLSEIHALKTLFVSSINWHKKKAARNHQPDDTVRILIMEEVLAQIDEQLDIGHADKDKRNGIVKENSDG
jgi:hypothetical protein